MVTRTRWFDLGPDPDLLNEIVDLALRRAHEHFRIDESRRTNHLFDNLRGLPQLPRAGCRREQDRRFRALVPLLECERPVVHRGRQAEAVVDEDILPRTIAGVLPVYLRHRNMALIDHGEVVVGEVVEQRVRRFSRFPPIQISRVVLDSGAESDLAHHFHVVRGAHPQALRLEKLPAVLEILETLVELRLNPCQGS